MSIDGTHDLTREELIQLLDATRAMARATVEPRFDDIMATVLNIALSATNSDRASLYVLDPASPGDVMLVGRHPPSYDALSRVTLDTSPMGEAISTGRARGYAIEDLVVRKERYLAAGLRQIAVIPVDVRGKRGASFNLARMRDVPYGERELRFAQLLGELLVVYADNARLYADAQRRLDETRMLVEVARAVSASPELDKRLDASATVLAHMLDASNAFIMLIEEGGTVLRGVTASNPAHRAAFREVRIPCDARSVAARAVATKHPVVIEDALASKEVRSELVTHYGEKSVVALPLLLRDEAIGAVIFDDTRRTRAWGVPELQRAELIVQTVAVGVANARLYDEVRRRSLELERAQAELLKRERLAAVGQLAAVMAHEVRNPLGVLFNSLGTLGKLVPGEGDSAQLLAIMREEATRLERLVRELLDFAKPLAPSLESESLQAMLSSAVDAATRELAPTGVPRIEVAIAEDVPLVSIDASMMRRAVVNLVVNAVHAAGIDGRVDVSASIDLRDDVRVAHIAVSDSGPGIPADVMPRVLEPFFTTKATGTGLGLAVVKSIVDSHGGELALASTPGVGTTVSIFLPLRPAKTERPAW